ncbi:hypothetical protein MHUMG1_03694 [Metarhizium humberi]|uniref:Uncharacterized protein n=1 Tax=Metarhizium humberi TaxID=2596975 RepID=A0A9P8S871_9HYPO|nr:hypothetical protein MHUMG1_03694 [Metarhizium humberi]
MDTTLQSGTKCIPIQTAAELAEALAPTEDWTGTASSAKRRKLQNRLNQRARRKPTCFASPDRLCLLLTICVGQGRRMLPLPSTSAVGPRSLPTTDDGAHHTSDNGKPSSAPTCLLGKAETRQLLLQVAQSSYGRYKIGSPSLADLNGVVRFNVFQAFGLIAQALGFNNDWLTYEATSPFCTPGECAPSLHAPPTRRPYSMNPTLLQLKVEHHPWIDFFPCPRLRDNLLAALVPGREMLDEDHLCRDVVDGGAGAGVDSAGLIVWGTPWEPGGWEVTESFVEKWGWLLAGCVELKEATNYWRGKRGLEGIVFNV